MCVAMTFGAVNVSMAATTAAAQIGATTYTSLTKAFNACKEGDVIKLLKDLDLRRTLTRQKLYLSKQRLQHLTLTAIQ